LFFKADERYISKKVAMLWRTAISTNTLFLTDISLNEQYSRPGTIYLFLRVEKFSASIFSDIHHPLEAPKSLETDSHQQPSGHHIHHWHIFQKWGKEPGGCSSK
jgi:hypothetical protein